MTGCVLDAGLAGCLMNSCYKRSYLCVSARKRCGAAKRCEILAIGPATCGVCLVCIGVGGPDYLNCGSAEPSVGGLRAVKAGAGLDLDLHSGARALGVQ